MAVAQTATGQDLHDLFRSVFKLQLVLERGMDRIHEKSGMSTPWKRVLYAMDTGEAKTVPDIAAELGVSRQFILKTCNDMIDAGFVEYADNPRHKRSKLVLATDLARAAYAETKRHEHKIIERVLPGVDAEIVRKAATLLDELGEQLVAAGLVAF